MQDLYLHANVFIEEFCSQVAIDNVLQTDYYYYYFLETLVDDLFSFDISWIIWIPQSYISYAVLHLLKTNSVKTDLIRICTQQSVSILEYFIIRTNNNNVPSPKFMPVAELKSHLRMIHSFLGQHFKWEERGKNQSIGLQTMKFASQWLYNLIAVMAWQARACPNCFWENACGALRFWIWTVLKHSQSVLLERVTSYWN